MLKAQFLVQNFHLKSLFWNFKLNIKTEGSIVGKYLLHDDILQIYKLDEQLWVYNVVSKPIIIVPNP